MGKVIIAIIVIFAIICGCSQQEPSQTQKVEEVLKNAAKTPRNEMEIKCEDDADFFQSLDDMKSKMQKAEQDELMQAISIIAKRKKFAPKEGNPYCNEFKGNTEEDIRNKAAN